MKKIKFKECPHCEEHGFENLRTYSHCVNCLFFEEHTGIPYEDYYEA